jgi:hypothetical protein
VKTIQREELIQMIRIAHSAITREKNGIYISQDEKQILEFLEPIDITQTLLQEIDYLNHQIVNLIYEYSILKSKQDGN